MTDSKACSIRSEIGATIDSKASTMTDPKKGQFSLLLYLPTP